MDNLNRLFCQMSFMTRLEIFFRTSHFSIFGGPKIHQSVVDAYYHDFCECLKKDEKTTVVVNSLILFLKKKTFHQKQNFKKRLNKKINDEGKSLTLEFLIIKMLITLA